MEAFKILVDALSMGGRVDENARNAGAPQKFDFVRDLNHKVFNEYVEKSVSKKMDSEKRKAAETLSSRQPKIDRNEIERNTRMTAYNNWVRKRPSKFEEEYLESRPYEKIIDAFTSDNNSYSWAVSRIRFKISPIIDSCRIDMQGRIDLSPWEEERKAPHGNSDPFFIFSETFRGRFTEALESDFELKGQYALADFKKTLNTLESKLVHSRVSVDANQKVRDNVEVNREEYICDTVKVLLAFSIMGPQVDFGRLGVEPLPAPTYRGGKPSALPSDVHPGNKKSLVLYEVRIEYDPKDKLYSYWDGWSDSGNNSNPHEILRGQKCFVGRDPKGDGERIIVRDIDNRVSRNHFSVTDDNGSWTAQNASEGVKTAIIKNGKIKGELEAQRTTMLCHGDLIRMADSPYGLRVEIR